MCSDVSKNHWLNYRARLMAMTWVLIAIWAFEYGYNMGFRICFITPLPCLHFLFNLWSLVLSHPFGLPSPQSLVFPTNAGVPFRTYAPVRQRGKKSRFSVMSGVQDSDKHKMDFERMGFACPLEPQKELHRLFSSVRVRISLVYRKGPSPLVISDVCRPSDIGCFSFQVCCVMYCWKESLS